MIEIKTPKPVQREMIEYHSLWKDTTNDLVMLFLSPTFSVDSKDGLYTWITPPLVQYPKDFVRCPVGTRFIFTQE